MSGRGADHASRDSRITDFRECLRALTDSVVSGRVKVAAVAATIQELRQGLEEIRGLGAKHDLLDAVVDQTLGLWRKSLLVGDELPELLTELDKCESHARKMQDLLDDPGGLPGRSRRLLEGAQAMSSSLTPNNNAARLDDLLTLESELRCPLTMMLFRHPVLAPDGHVYEKDALDNSMAGQLQEVQFQPAEEIRLRAMEFRRSSVEKLLQYAEEVAREDIGLAAEALDRVDEYLRDLKQECAEGSTTKATELRALLKESCKNRPLTEANLETSTLSIFGQRRPSHVRFGEADVDISPSSGAYARRQQQARPDFQSWLDRLLAIEESAIEFAQSLYPRFSGQVDRLGELQNFLEATAGVPPALSRLLTQHLFAANSFKSESCVSQNVWATAFHRWLQTVRARIGQAKLSRKALVRKRMGKSSLHFNSIYFIGNKIGEGAFGEVFVTLHKLLGVERVVKTIHKEQLTAGEGELAAEVEVLKSLDHPFIIRIYETFDTPDTLRIVMDYADGGDLASMISKARAEARLIPEEWVCAAGDQMSAALEYVHWMGVIHCDLKPANAMLLQRVDPFQGEMPHVLLVDFGLAEMFNKKEADRKGKLKGTPLYLSPEAFEGRMSEKSDIWALGVTIFELLSGQRPFEESNPFALYRKLTKTEPCLDSFSSIVQEVLRGMLAKDPNLRLSAKQCHRMNWFRQQVLRVQSAPPTCKSLGKHNFFHRTAMMCIASELSMKDRQDMFKSFMSIDLERSGCLSLVQLADGLARRGDTSDPSTVLNLLDMDQNGFISYTEFLAGFLGIDDYLSERLVSQAFNILDADSKGFVTKHDLQVLVSGEDGALVDVLPDGQTIEQVIDDVGSDGKIVISQFRKHLLTPGECEGSSVEFPMMVMKMHDFLSLSELEPHHILVETGRLVEAPLGAVTHFVSWQWLAASHPDPQCKQLTRLQNFFKSMKRPGGAVESFDNESWESFSTGAVKSTQDAARVAVAKVHRMADHCDATFDVIYAHDIQNGYVWIDFASIPQVTSDLTADECAEVQGERALAIRCIPTYVTRSTYFYMCALTSFNEQHEVIDFHTWRLGGWCRAEELANFLSPNVAMNAVVLTDAPKAHVLDFFDFFLFRANIRASSVFNGHFTCCQRGHVRMIQRGRKWFTPCDKHLLADMLGTMYDRKLEALQNNDFLFRMYKVLEPSIFAGSDSDCRNLVCSPEESIPEFLLRFKLPQDPMVPDSSGCSPMEWAAFLGHEPMVAKLLEVRCSAAVADNGGLTPLLGASLCCNPEKTVTTLIEKGCLATEAINQGTHTLGITPLDRAAKGGLVDVVRILVSNRASPNVRRKDGRTPLHIAAADGHKEVCRVLLESLADVNALAENGEGPLHAAAHEFSPFGLSRKKRIEVVPLLLGSRADINIRNKSGCTPLQIAAEEKHYDFIDALKAAMGEQSTEVDVSHAATSTNPAAPRRLRLDAWLRQVLSAPAGMEQVASVAWNRQGGDEALIEAILAALDAHSVA